ncbi:MULTISPECIES: TrkA family potassium uptake protein [unclassified Kaistella]|uniref:potassium channel family protein n=1 Tax=unclassified Kaistella TaxID=2762626 RepID=UPI0027329C6D|nr:MULTISPECIES: TrkA family potassium uptake protein [unclassified Kaistella]MCZ2083714.1 TrkA family potassium uptake protein [Flavobacteriales bacterium]MDP2452851.1 TrkA family potassium uptake protein [Kaistella sp. SH11-4b]MDP2455760.1 TrkA family potassium uptake protein [Kaistella sp. SH40-3]MDP2458664.1 TrkA family potassium uptake protein [Kaistella sp. SH19-2b]
MKYIVIGLGNFGLSLAEKLTKLGNEVIGVDNSMTKVESVKEKISHAICLDATDEFTMGGLPWKDTDIVIIAIGEDTGANIMATAMVKKLHPNRIISRAITPIHETILEAMEVETIIHPEDESAERWAKKLSLKGMVDSFELSINYSIVEIAIPDKLVGKTIEEVEFRHNYNLVCVSIIKKIADKNLFGKTKRINKIQGVVNVDTVLESADILVIYGENEDIKKFIKSN